MSGPFDEQDDPKAEFWYKFRSAVAVILSLAVLVGGCVFVGVKTYDAYISYKSADDYLGDGEKDVLVRVPSGASVSEVGSILLDNDVIKSTKAYNKAIRESESDVTIQAGQYKLKTHMSAAKAVSILGNPDNIQRTRVTLPEGLTTEEQFAIMAKGTTMPVDSFKVAYKQTKKLGLPVWAKDRPEGFLFPDTYEVGSNPTPLEILQMQANQFVKQVNTMNFMGQAQTIKRSPYDALIVASILEKEARNQGHEDGRRHHLQPSQPGYEGGVGCDGAVRQPCRRKADDDRRAARQGFSLQHLPAQRPPADSHQQSWCGVDGGGRDPDQERLPVLGRHGSRQGDDGLCQDPGRSREECEEVPGVVSGPQG